jgi:hypothetical protein
LDFFPEGLAIIKMLPTKVIEENDSCRKTIDRLAELVLLILGKFIQRSYKSCQKRLKVSIRFSVRGFRGFC